MRRAHLTLGAHRVDITTRCVVVGVVDLPATAGALSGTGNCAIPRVAFVETAGALVVEGAAVIELGCAAQRPAHALAADCMAAAVRAVCTGSAVAVAVTTPSATVARAASAAGAVLWRDTTGFGDPTYLRAAADAGASVIAADIALTSATACAARCEAAGLDADRVVLEAAAGADAATGPSALVDAAARLAVLGYPVAVSFAGAGDAGATADAAVATPTAWARGAALGALAAAIASGARFVRAGDALDVRAARRVADVMAAILEAA